MIYLKYVFNNIWGAGNEQGIHPATSIVGVPTTEIKQIANYPRCQDIIEKLKSWNLGEFHDELKKQKDDDKSFLLDISELLAKNNEIPLILRQTAQAILADIYGDFEVISPKIIINQNLPELKDELDIENFAKLGVEEGAKSFKLWLQFSPIVTDKNFRNFVSMAVRVKNFEGLKIYMDIPRFPKIKWPKGQNPLISAAINNDCETIKFLLSIKPPPFGIEEKCELGHTALMHAIMAGHKEACDLLMNLGAKLPRMETNKEFRALVLAVVDIKHIQLLKELMADPLFSKIKWHKGKNPLIRAAIKNDCEAIEFLHSFNNGQPLFNIEHPCVLGRTAFMHAVIANRNDACNLLMKMGANIHGCDRFGMNSIYLAARHNNDRILNVLLERGVDPNAKTHLDGTTPIICAAAHNENITIKKLVQYGADVDSKDALGRSALMYAIHYSCESSVRTLIALGADVLMNVGYYNTILNYAAARDTRNLGTNTALEGAFKNLFMGFVKGGGDINVRTIDGKTALMLAVLNGRYGHETAVKNLLEYGANVNAYYKDGLSALIDAVANKKIGCVSPMMKEETLKSISYQHFKVAWKIGMGLIGNHELMSTLEPGAKWFGLDIQERLRKILDKYDKELSRISEMDRISVQTGWCVFFDFCTYVDSLIRTFLSTRQGKATRDYEERLYDSLDDLRSEKVAMLKEMIIERLPKEEVPAFNELTSPLIVENFESDIKKMEDRIQKSLDISLSYFEDLLSIRFEYGVLNLFEFSSHLQEITTIDIQVKDDIKNSMIGELYETCLKDMMRNMVNNAVSLLGHRISERLTGSSKEHFLYLATRYIFSKLTKDVNEILARIEVEWKAILSKLDQSSSTFILENGVNLLNDYMNKMNTIVKELDVRKVDEDKDFNEFYRKSLIAIVHPTMLRKMQSLGSKMAEKLSGVERDFFFLMMRSEGFFIGEKKIVDNRDIEKVATENFSGVGRALVLHYLKTINKCFTKAKEAMDMESWNLEKVKKCGGRHLCDFYIAVREIAETSSAHKFNQGLVILARQKTNLLFNAMVEKLPEIYRGAFAEWTGMEIIAQLKKDKAANKKKLFDRPFKAAIEAVNDWTAEKILKDGKDHVLKFIECIDSLLKEDHLSVDRNIQGGVFGAFYKNILGSMLQETRRETVKSLINEMAKRLSQDKRREFLSQFDKELAA